jgi:CzcA family heavy metal efflux pump
MKSYFNTYKNPILVILAMVILGGLVSYSRMQRSLFPQITFPKIKVIADNGLQPVNKMMVTVTKPLEDAIKQVPGLQYVRSTTSRGSCEISAFMDWNSDIDMKKQQIDSRINEIRGDLPAGVHISVEKMSPSILSVMGYTLESHTESPIALKQLALYTIKPYLSQVTGVSQVAVVGGKTKEYWIKLDEQKMARLSITPAMISQSLRQTNFILPNGYLPDYRRLYLNVTDAMVSNTQQLGDVVISNNGKRVIRLKDIAKIVIHPAISYVRINANGKPAVLVAVLKQPDANLIDVSNQVEQKVVSLKNILPADVSIKPYYIQADFVHRAVRSVSDALWIGILLAIIVAVIFLRSWKASLTLLVVIPISLTLTIIALRVIGYTLNIMTLGALVASIALIVDDAIVVSEQIHRSSEEYPDDDDHSIVHKAISFLFPAMVASSMSTIVIFIPFMLMSGLAGAYFKVLANAMIVTLVCSFFVTWLGLPVVYLLFSKKKKKRKKKKAHTVRQQRWVSYFIHRPILSLVIIAGMVAIIFLIIPRLQTGFLPAMDEGAIVMDYTSPPGTSLDETDYMCQQVEKIIMGEPEVESYSRRTGTQMGFFITEPNTGDYLIELKSKRTRTTEQVIDDIRGKIEASQPALRVDFGQVISDMLGDLSSSVQPIEIKIFGNDQGRLDRLAKQVSSIVDNVKGTADVFDGIVIAGPSVQVIPHPDELAQYGLTPAELQYQLQTHLGGNVIGEILEPEKLTNIRMIYAGALRSSVVSEKKESIFLPGGELKPLTDLADVQIAGGAAEIQRQNLQNMVVVTARLNNRDLGGVMKDIRQEVGQKVFMPKGYHIEYGGQYAEQQQSFSELLMILITACLLVFGVILFLSKDFLSSLIILLIAVLGTAGCLLALFMTGTPLNVSSYTGIIMIVGIIGENAIFTLLQFLSTLKDSNTDNSLVYAISTRLRPKLMTAIGAIVALLPLALGIGAGAQLHQPLAIAVIGGFVIAMPLLLIVLPTMLRLRYKDWNVVVDAGKNA